MLPVSSAGGKVTPFNETLFTSTSAVCVTGLVLHDTATYWSAFGQSGTVEKQVVVGFDTIYGEKEDGTFEISALNFQSDIDIAGSVYISHELLPASVTAGFSGDTFASVKVYTDSTKNTLLKEFAESASTINPILCHSRQ